MEKLLSCSEVADRLGYSLDHFRRSWRTWRRRHGFPAPLVGLKWDVDALDAWRASRASAMELGAAPERAGRRSREITDDDRQRAAQRNVERLARQNQAARRPPC